MNYVENTIGIKQARWQICGNRVLYGFIIWRSIQIRLYINHFLENTIFIMCTSAIFKLIVLNSLI